MNEHWNDEQFAAALMSETDAEAAAHLAACGQCQAGLAALREHIAEMRAAVESATARSESFWATQRIAINERVAAPSWWIHWLPVPLMAAAGLVIALAMNVPPAPSIPVVTAEAQEQQLLEEVAAAIDANTPTALVPVQTLAVERSRHSTKGAR